MLDLNLLNLLCEAPSKLVKRYDKKHRTNVAAEIFPLIFGVVAFFSKVSLNTADSI